MGSKINQEYFIYILKKIYLPTEKTLLAFSGGPDSTALFFLLLELKKEYSSFSFEVFHLNHLLRDRESFSDAGFVKLESEKYGIVFHLIEKDIAKIAEKNKLSIEEAGRKERYKELYRIKENRDLDSISTAHHMDDNIETFIMRLFMGGGTRALTGMKPREGNLVRPLIYLKKKEILDYLRLNQIEYRIDKSNENNQYLRNKVRNLIVPRIEENFPQFRKKISQLQDIFNKREEFIKKFLIQWNQFKNQVLLQREDFLKVPDLLLPDQILSGLKTLNKDYYISYDNLESVIGQIKSWDSQGHKIFLETGNYSIIGSHGSLFIVNQKFFQEIQPEFILKPLEKYPLGEKTLKNISSQSLFFQKPKTGEAVSFHHTKKLKDFLIDKKIFYHFRKHILIIKKENGIFLGVLEAIGENLFLNNEGEKLIEIENREKDAE